MSGPESLLLQLSRFVPERLRAPADDWTEMVRLAPLHGLAPTIAYNVEYRLAGANAPQDARDALLAHYQAALNDNVFKFVNLKKLLAEVGSRRALLLDAAAFADALYPHVAFRPVNELRLLVHVADLEPMQRAFAQAGYAIRPNDDELGASAVNSDDRTRLVLHTRLFPEARQVEESKLWERALPARAFGKNAFRPELEDALLSAALLLARQGFDAPLIQLVDLRELVRGSPDLAGPYSRPVKADVVLERARAFKLERALWSAMELLAGFFPEVGSQARSLQPRLRPSSQTLLRKLVIEPSLDLSRKSAFRGTERLRRLLSGG
jgi:hypothetical protein